MKVVQFGLVCFTLVLGSFGAGPKFAPYYDVTLIKPDLQDVLAKTGLKDYTLAFALGNNDGCVPSWGAQFPINDAEILAPIHNLIDQGGQMVLATGGAAGPYLEHLCSTPEALKDAYKLALDTVRTNHLDIDIEATVNLDLMNTALAQLQQERPETTVSFTLMVQGEDYGVTDFLGVAVLESARDHGVRVDIVNAMTMEYPKLPSTPTWGQSIVNAANSTLYQMKLIWPDKPESELQSMIGITPMLGRNFNSNYFMPEDARLVKDYAVANGIGFISFWSIGRDNGDCATGVISPNCSGIAQAHGRSSRFTDDNEIDFLAFPSSNYVSFFKEVECICVNIYCPPFQSYKRMHRISSFKLAINFQNFEEAEMASRTFKTFAIFLVTIFILRIQSTPIVNMDYPEPETTTEEMPSPMAIQPKVFTNPGLNFTYADLNFLTLGQLFGFGRK